MSDPVQAAKKEMELQRNINRVALNLMVLLDTGIFPGKHAEGLTEVKGFVANIIRDSEAKMQPHIIPAAAPAPETPTAA